MSHIRPVPDTASLGQANGHVFLPPRLRGLTGWWDATRITGVGDGDALGTWPDVSRSGNDASQSTTSSKPAYQPDPMSGLPAVEFDGGDDHLALPANTLPSQAFTLAAACKIAAPTGMSTIMSWGEDAFLGEALEFRIADVNGDGSLLAPQLQGKDSSRAYGFTSSVNVKNSRFIAICRWDGDQVVLRTNGIEDTGTLSLSPAVSKWRIGCLERNATANFYAGHIGELAYFDQAVSQQSMIRLEAYFTGKWGI